MSVIIRPMQDGDMAAASALQARVYQSIPAFSQQQFDSLLQHFPRGQVVAESDGQLVGMALSLVVLWDEYSLHHTWASVTGDGMFNTFDPHGRTLYGIEVCVDADCRGQGVGRRLYEARRWLCRAMNLKRIIAGGRLPGYVNYATQMSPEEYAKRVVWGDIYDPVLRFQLDEGFDYCGVLHGYLPTDVDSVGNAALIVWLNRDHDPAQPTSPPPSWSFL